MKIGGSIMIQSTPGGHVFEARICRAIRVLSAVRAHGYQMSEMYMPTCGL